MTRKPSVLFGFALLLASGCVQQQKDSSGRIGCPPEEITVSDETETMGYVTWKATCRGRTFYCSNSQGDGEIACAEELSVKEEESQPVDDPPKPEYSTTRLPDEALGFIFGSDLASVRLACEEAGHEWSQVNPAMRCSGTPRDVGVPTRNLLRFCEGKLCDLTVFLELSPDAQADRQFEQLRTALVKRYGEPIKSTERAPPKCGGQLMACVSAGSAEIEFEWQWTGGERLVVKAAGDTTTVEIVLRYILDDAEPLEEGEIDGAAF